jgi:hypothetical protein
LILVVKYIFTGLQFNFVLLTTTMHFLGTYMAMTVFKNSGWFEAKSPPSLWDTFRVSAWSVGSIVMMNFSLRTNSVGFYQMMKIVIIPVMLVVNWVSKGTAIVGLWSGAAVAVLSIGLTMATVHDVSLTPLGFAFGVAAVVCTVGFQLGIQSCTQAHGLSATQLQYDIALPQALITFMIALPAECFVPANILQALAEAPILIPASVSLSVLLAMGVNYYCFAVIGRFSAVTYQVVSHAKTILVLVFGSFLFLVKGEGENQRHTQLHLLGLAIATLGVILYSLAQMREKAQQQKQQQKQSPEKKKER